MLEIEWKEKHIKIIYSKKRFPRLSLIQHFFVSLFYENILKINYYKENENNENDNTGKIKLFKKFF